MSLNGLIPYVHTVTRNESHEAKICVKFFITRTLDKTTTTKNFTPLCSSKT